MNFICNKNKLYEAISNVSKAIPSKSNIQALEGIKLSLNENNLELTGYDLEFGIRTNFKVNSSDKGEFVVNSRLMSEIIRRMSSSDIAINIDEKLNVTITGDNVQYDISAISADEYPDFPAIGTERSIDIPQYILKSMIEQTNHAVSTNENKPILTGELFDIENKNFNMVAIDGFRLAVRNERITESENNNFVVPSKTLNEIAKLLSKNEMVKSDDDTEFKPEDMCHIFTDSKHIIFNISSYYVVSRLLEGEFHNYRASIPQDFKTEVILKTKDFAECIERCSLLISEKNKSPIRCEFDGGELNVSCKTAVGKFNETINVEINGEPIEIGFNNKYLLDALKACETDKIKMQLLAPNRPIKILPITGESFMYLLMPIQLRK